MTIRLLNETRDCVVAEDVELADTVWKRVVGLMGRDTLEPGHALLIEPCSSIHMFFMKFAIDVIYLDGRDKVIKIVRNLPPWRISAAKGARKVVEMAAGSLTDEIEEGDQMKMEELD